MRFHEMFYTWAWRVAAISALALALVTLFARPAHGQDVPVVFQHGVKSDGHTWDATASALAHSDRIDPVQPSLSWYRQEQSQADQLGAKLDASGIADGFPTIGHSNGGLVLREYARRGGRSGAVITIGTPHLGAPAAANWLNGRIQREAGQAARTIADPVQFYRTNDWNIGIIDFVFDATDKFVDVLWDIGRYMCGGVGFCLAASTGVITPVVTQLAPGSAYLASLNSAANLAAEDQNVDYRASLSTRFQLINPYCYLVTSAATKCVVTRGIAIILYLEAYQHYADSPDLVLSTNAYRWLRAAGTLVDLDAMWQSWIGTLTNYDWEINPVAGYIFTQMTANANDGFIPEYSAVMPGQVSHAHIRVPGNLCHSMQTSSTAVRAQLASLLENDLGVVPRQLTVTSHVGIYPASATVLVGQTTQLVATAYNELDEPLSRIFTWSSSNPAIASVTSTGLVTGRATGTATIRAVADGFTGISTVTVISKVLQ